MRERLMELRVEELRGFRNQPFQVKEDEAMDALCESIALYGVLSPLLARPVGEGYEIISGHRRRAAALRLGLDKLPVLVRDMSDDEAVILMVDSNIQRENLLPSEKAFAYKMKLEAVAHQGKTCGQVGHKSRDSLSDEESGRTVQRYIRLTNLAKLLLDMVDEQKIALSPAVELSYLTKQEQAELWDIMQCEYAEKVRIAKKAGMETRNTAIRAEDMAMGVFVHVGDLPKHVPHSGVRLGITRFEPGLQP